MGVSATLLPAKIAQIDPANKIALIPVFSAVAMIVATIANILAGALSDMTRTRWGKRTPWIVVCSILSAALLYLLSVCTNIASLLIVWAVYQAVLNAVVAPMVAQLSDRVAPRWRGTISSFYGAGMAFGNYGSGIIASQFLGNVGSGIQVLAVFALAGGLISAFLAKESSNLDEPREKFSAATLKSNFMFPTHNCRDYYLTLGGKLLMVTGQYVIVGYQLYIFSDYMKLSTSQQESSVAIMSTILMITGIICCAVAVLPDPNTAAKDLGIINMANTLGQVSGPIIAGGVIAIAGYRAIFPVETLICVIGGLMIMGIKRVK